MDTYLYKYNCPTWYGLFNKSGLRNINARPERNEKEIINMATNLEQKLSGSKNCSIALLQKYQISIKNIKNYSALTSIPLNINVNECVNNE